ncbi:hypothetical protein [Glutamicibacter mysorens]|uniref:hypothetical protein n=1 Tax=Glutamicibacter mysorens TaxID=257984 RepID=UPI0020C65D5C|nr:hypothetical protein [Glutamicibacter mysorens]UTM45889.1 hypothetical protein XH9_09895 [Glutamicibacter mysorens]
MPGRIVRTRTAVRVADFLATREGKAHLSDYGWAQGMPIVMTQPAETLNDAMGMASIHGRAVLVAMLDPQTEELHMMHVTVPQAALKVTKACADRLTMGEFFERLATELIAEFRVKFWKNTAVAHKIPACPAMQSRTTSSARYPMPAHQSGAERVAAGTSR